MFPFRVATLVSSPLGTNRVLLEVPALMVTHVEQTIPHTHSTLAKALSMSRMMINLGKEDCELAGSWIRGHPNKKIINRLNKHKSYENTLALVFFWGYLPTEKRKPSVTVDVKQVSTGARKNPSPFQSLPQTSGFSVAI